MAKYTYDQRGIAYHLKGGKHTCPSCGQHTLQLYLRVKDSQPVADSCGKCDRLINCAYNLKPWAYFAENPDELPSAADALSIIGRTPPPKPAQLIAIPWQYVALSAADGREGQTDFADHLLTMFRPADVAAACLKYHIGRTKDKSIIFWQIDEDGRVHEGKVMAYNFASGGRDKASWGSGSRWVFSTLQGRGVLPAHEDDGQTPAKSSKIFFGQHLLSAADGNMKVCITESEKNAIYGSIVYPEYTWLAAGSAIDLRPKLAASWRLMTKCKAVVLVPDADRVKEWEVIAAEYSTRLNICVGNVAAGHAMGTDLADLLRLVYLNNPAAVLRPAGADSPRQNPDGGTFGFGAFEFERIASPADKLQAAEKIWAAYMKSGGRGYDGYYQVEAWRAGLFAATMRANTPLPPSAPAPAPYMALMRAENGAVDELCRVFDVIITAE